MPVVCCWQPLDHFVSICCGAGGTSPSLEHTLLFYWFGDLVATEVVSDVCSVVVVSWLAADQCHALGERERYRRHRGILARLVWFACLFEGERELLFVCYALCALSRFWWLQRAGWLEFQFRRELLLLLFLRRGFRLVTICTVQFYWLSITLVARWLLPLLSEFFSSFSFPSFFHFQTTAARVCVLLCLWHQQSKKLLLR